MCLCGAAAACLWSRLTSGVARAKTSQGVERLNITHTAILQLRVHPLDELISSSTHFYCSLQYTQSPSSYLMFVSMAYISNQLFGSAVFNLYDYVFDCNSMLQDLELLLCTYLLDYGQCHFLLSHPLVNLVHAIYIIIG